MLKKMLEEMMPFYNWSLSELLVNLNPNEDLLPFGLFNRIALGLLSAGAFKKNRHLWSGRDDTIENKVYDSRTHRVSDEHIVICAQHKYQIYSNSNP